MSDIHPYLLLGALLFVCGAICMATKRNAIGVLMGVELVLNGANLHLLALPHFSPGFEIEGQIFARFVIELAAAEASVALAIVLNFYNNHMTVDVDTAEELKGYPCSPTSTLNPACCSSWPRCCPWPRSCSSSWP